MSKQNLNSFIEIDEKMLSKGVLIQEQINSWKRFLSDQKIIRYVEDKEVLNILKKIYPFEDGLFAVFFPKSALDYIGYLQGKKDSHRVAVFHEDGNTTIFSTSESRKKSYTETWEEIVSCVKGSNIKALTSIRLPRKKIMSINLFDVQVKYEKRIQIWVDKFNEIPGVSARKYFGSDESNLIEVALMGTLNTFVAKREDTKKTIVRYCLTQDDTFHLHFVEGEFDKVFIQWEVKLSKLKGVGWNNFYKEVIRLSLCYQNLIQ